VEDQISYPLTVSLLGVPEIKTIRSYSFFGFSTIYIIFKDNVEFYWSRTRVLEKLNSLPAGTLPAGVQPALGPDATALGQIYWYTLEGMDPDGEPAGGWDLEELRTIQDWYARYWLLSADGVSEVASVGGFVREYQVDVDPDAMRAYRVSFADVAKAVKASNIDVGAKVMELNRVEYFVRGIGFIENVADIENSVVKVHDNVPVLIKHVAGVTLGPALRRGMLDKGGAEAVGGVVVARYGDNPLAVIKNIKKKIKEEIGPALPEKAVIDFAKVTPNEIRRFAREHDFDAYVGAEINQKEWKEYLKDTERAEWPEWITTSKVTVVPFYDRTGLIYETLGTLRDSLSEEILITAIVVILMVMHLRSSILISGMLPLAVLLCFIAMSVFGVDANIVALSGIVIAIGTIVDMGIVVCENILRHLDEAPPEVPRLEVVHRAASEVASAVVTAVLTTIVSFLPVFTMMGAEGKLFKPLAFTKTFALLASIVIALTILPPAAHILFCGKLSGKMMRYILHGLVVAVGVVAGFLLSWWAGMALILFGAYYLLEDYIPARYRKFAPWAASGIAVLFVGVLLTEHWEPLGPERGMTRNLLFVGMLVAFLLGFFRLFQIVYPRLLGVCLRHKFLFMVPPVLLFAAGLTMWWGPGAFFGKISDEYLAQDFSEEQLEKLSAVERFKYGLVELKDKKWEKPDWIKRKSGRTKIKWTLAQGWDGLGKEFMPPLDEGSYLFMPTTMVHASIGEAADILAKQDQAISNIPEIDSVVGKLGRAETPLDPAPVSMIETVINYKPEYITGKDGRRVKFAYDNNTQKFKRDEYGELIRDAHGLPYRQWRSHIKSPDDIWKEILKATEIPGTTSAPKLQPIAARIVMLQSGMRAPMGVKVKGPTLEVIEEVGLQIERYLKELPSVEPAAVVADRIVGKPYLEIVPDREAIARYGVPIRVFNDVVEIAVGGRKITTTVEGRERFPFRVRYQRELRDSIETLEKILVP
ncbi:MAG: efflux RND transporter permease subunit, partial [Phycisphaerae bacterium]|nr:efflux RND transporter permease subunit [Phycisphaerae bacterium]